MDHPFAHTSWFFAAYGAGLFYLLVSPDKVKSNKALIIAYVLFGVAIFIGVFFTPFRARAEAGRSRDLVDIWAHGLTWLTLGLSLMALPWAVLDLEFDPLNLQGRKAARERTPRRSAAASPRLEPAPSKPAPSKPAPKKPAPKKPAPKKPEPVTAELLREGPEPLDTGESGVGHESDINELFDVEDESDIDEVS